jgi:hypothetical protein
MIFEVRKTEKPGGGWLVQANHTVQSDEISTNKPVGTWAFRTLDHARSFIGDLVKVDKRVRMTKITDDFYTYRS